ncbi:hypothetical protein NE865_11950 [Phthorimaea operculella]|nr:hypothetical protein NE865_11950 [Phthorimaea operculella]
MKFHTKDINAHSILEQINKIEYSVCKIIQKYRMKLLAILLLAGCVCASVVPQEHAVEVLEQSHPASRNWIVDQAVNAVVNQAIAILRRIINATLDPLELEHYHLYLPAGLINLDLNLNDVFASGFGGFRTRRSRLNIRTLVLELDLLFPRIHIRSKYDLVGDLFTAIPLYGNGDAEFIVEDFNFQATIKLRQSDDGKSVIIDKIEELAFEIPGFKSNLTGVIGGGEDLDAIVNAIVEEVIIKYVTRFRGAIGIVAGGVITSVINPVLETLDTWRFLAPFV